MESLIECYRALGVESVASLSLIVKLKGVSAIWITYLHGLVLLWCFFNRCTMCFLIIYEQVRVHQSHRAETPSFFGGEEGVSVLLIRVTDFHRKHSAEGGVVQTGKLEKNEIGETCGSVEQQN